MKLIAYELYEGHGFTIEPAGRTREWMDAAPFAYRCLPMTIANQMGWIIPCPIDFTIRWDGGGAQDAIQLTFGEQNHPNNAYVRSHFGSGIVTFSMPFLFRTPPGYGLIVRGAPNYIIRGVHPLDGFVETDWNNSTFTMNWKITEPDRIINVKKGEPLCMITPFKIDELNDVEPDIMRLVADPDTLEGFNAWNASRSAFLQRTDLKPHEWQKDYVKQMNVPKLQLRSFHKSDGIK